MSVVIAGGIIAHPGIVDQSKTGQEGFGTAHNKGIGNCFADGLQQQTEGADRGRFRIMAASLLKSEIKTVKLEVGKSPAAEGLENIGGNAFERFDTSK